MKQLNFNVSGKPTDTPRIVSDHDTSYAGIFESSSRCIFKIPDTETGQGHLFWQGNELLFVFPQYSGFFEATDLGLPAIEYRLNTPKIHVEGTRFIDETGEEFFFRMNTDFMLLKRFIDGDNIQILLNQRVSVGSNGVRVLGMAFNLFRFNPEKIRGYYDYLRLFARILAENNLYLEYVAFADLQLIPIQDKFNHWFSVQDALSKEPNVFIELANEFAKNGVNPYEFEHPKDIISSQGSNLGDGFYPPSPGWDYHTWHGRRDWKSIFSSCEDLYSLANGKWDKGHKVAPAVQNEPIKFGSSFETNAFVGKALGITSRLFGSGCTFHFSHGLQSEMMDGLEYNCGLEMLRG
jgi:hypothetical protein